MAGERRRWSLRLWWDWASFALPVWLLFTAARFTGAWAILVFIGALFCALQAVLRVSEAVIEDDDGLGVRANLRTKVYPWGEIQGFAVKREGFGLRPFMMLPDGYAKWLGSHSLADERAREMIDSLNERLEVEHAAR